MSFASDTFAGTGALLDGRMADIGGAWTVRAGVMATTGSVLTGTDYFLATLTSASPGSADYDVSVDIIAAIDTAPGIVGRAHATNLDYYYFRFLPGDGYQLYRFQGGSPTLIGFQAASPATGSSIRLTLRLRGSTISGMVDGIEKVSTTDTTFTAPGVVGIRNGGSGSLATFDNFSASTPATRRGYAPYKQSVSCPVVTGVSNPW